MRWKNSFLQRKNIAWSSISLFEVTVVVRDLLELEPWAKNMCVIIWKKQAHVTKHIVWQLSSIGTFHSVYTSISLLHLNSFRHYAWVKEETGKHIHTRNRMNKGRTVNEYKNTITVVSLIRKKNVLLSMEIFSRTYTVKIKIWMLQPHRLESSPFSHRYIWPPYLRR